MPVTYTTSYVEHICIDSGFNGAAGDIYHILPLYDRIDILSVLNSDKYTAESDHNTARANDNANYNEHFDSAGEHGRIDAGHLLYDILCGYFYLHYQPGIDCTASNNHNFVPVYHGPSVDSVSDNDSSRPNDNSIRANNHSNHNKHSAGEYCGLDLPVFDFRDVYDVLLSDHHPGYHNFRIAAASHDPDNGSEHAAWPDEYDHHPLGSACQYAVFDDHLLDPVHDLYLVHSDDDLGMPYSFGERKSSLTLSLAGFDWNFNSAYHLYAQLPGDYVQRSVPDDNRHINAARFHYCIDSASGDHDQLVPYNDSLQLSNRDYGHIDAVVSTEDNFVTGPTETVYCRRGIDFFFAGFEQHSVLNAFFVIKIVNLYSTHPTKDHKFVNDYGDSDSNGHYQLERHLASASFNGNEQQPAIDDLDILVCLGIKHQHLHRGVHFFLANKPTKLLIANLVIELCLILSSTSYEACPTQTQDICGSQNQGTTCSSTNGTAYNVNCGIAYVGTEVDESDVNYPPRPSASSSSGAQAGKRAFSGPEWTFDYCQETCNWTPSCMAINFVNDNCNLLQNITGHRDMPNAMRAKPVVVYTPPASEPTHFNAMKIFMSDATPSACSRRVVTGTYTLPTTRRELK
ncbi:hypothetical protein PRZ48_005573 [Zasmidium cellare]|uniref:Apple domain-containing protein n=1 Tax=Zasmidium cellare TaxID=395010 RepID=A0ABR0ELM5_ZASCE|nr:hypothetical protein PRZ48_005573 [Zasmidium cellare]